MSDNVKLYEFTGYVRRSMVIAAVSEDDARRELATYNEGFCNNSDFIDLTDVYLINVRTPKSEDLTDEAHVISDAIPQRDGAGDGEARR